VSSGHFNPLSLGPGLEAVHYPVRESNVIRALPLPRP
jgi:hypothetical protein